MAISSAKVDGAAGHAEIVFAREPGGATFIRRQFASYPFHCCRPHHFVGDPPGMATLYLQSLAGGIYENDRLEISLVVEAGAQAHVTTQASTIVHGMAKGSAEQKISIEAERDSLAEFLPDPTILFPASRLTSLVKIRAHHTATVIASDSFLLHDPGGGGLTFDMLTSAIHIEAPDGTILARDSFKLAGGVLAEKLPGVNGSRAVQGTFLVVDRKHRASDLVTALREALDCVPDIYAGASALPGASGAWARLLATDGVAFKAGIEAAWFSLRELLTGQQPAARRK